MKLSTIISLLALICPALIFSQGETNNWYFGDGAGIHFNGDGSVTALTDGQINTVEGCATISDAMGALLFYTDGITVYNSNHEIMQNGQGLYGDPSSTQSALIVPKPEDANLYYIFTVDTSAFDGDPDFGLNYSVVDISMNNGGGEVIEKNVRLLSDCSEKIAAVVKDCADKSIWVITLASLNGSSSPFDTFHAFEVSPTGVQTTAVRSTFTDLVVEDPRGYLKLSSDGTKIVSANGRFGLYIYDFDAQTGRLSNQEKINIAAPSKFPYGVEFSPSGQYLYIHASNDIQAASGHSSSLVQYDLFATNISGSEVLLDNRGNYRGALQLGDNGKIYRTISQSYLNGTTFLGVINRPNSGGTAANYNHNAVSLEGKIGSQGLPPFIQSFFNKIDLIQNTDGTSSSSLSLCGGEGFVLQAEDIPGGIYSWTKDGDAFTNPAQNILEITSASDEDSGRYRLVITTSNPSDCPIIGEAAVFIDPVPVAGNISLTQCDVDFANPSDGITAIDLEQIENDESTFSYFYYETITDRDNHNPIPNPRNYSNTSAFNQTIYYRVVNSLGCENSGEMQLEVMPIILNTDPANTLYACDDDPNDNLQSGTFDLEAFGQSNFPGNSVNYYKTLEDVTLEENPLENNYSTAAITIYARVENSNQCENVVEISLVVNPTPIISIDQTFQVCTDNPTLSITASDGFDTYRFVKIEGGSEQPVSTEQTAQILEAGNYKLYAGYVYTNNSETSVCENSVDFNVLPSNIAVINDVLIKDISQNNTIQIEVSGDGDYEFSMDGNSYQSSNFFDNVPPGFLTVFVRDKNGCGISTEVISIIGYPKFFTPNGDGTNDLWQLVGVNSQFQANSTIFIFNRFGKQMAQIDVDSGGWDGTNDTKELPASDYWFRAFLEDGREFKGHFALKR